MDALHIAAANLARCKMLVTAEKVNKPMFRTKLVPVVSITDPPTTQSTSGVHRQIAALISQSSN
jgi:hypothetical protein